MEVKLAKKALATVLTLFFAIITPSQGFGAGTEFFLSSKADNDLYRVFRLNDIECSRYDTPSQAIEKAPDGAPVLILADTYPSTATRIDESLLA
ncbi:MAG: hypothetical protein EHM23_02550, partial [Acidobacteria bacterium]